MGSLWGLQQANFSWSWHWHHIGTACTNPVLEHQSYTIDSYVSKQGQSKQTSATAERNTCDMLLLTLAYLYVFPFLLKGWVRYLPMIRQVVYHKDLLNPSSPGERTNTMCTIYQSYSKSKDEWCGKSFLSGKRQIVSWTEQGIVIKTIWPLSVVPYTGGPSPMGRIRWKEDISHTGQSDLTT